MKKVENFLENFRDTLDIEDKTLNMSDAFREYEEWDSIANLSVIAMIDVEYDLIIDNGVFKNINTLQELWDTIQEGK
tara:strand:+ start:35 stop:265 length:231 start_codon:yes stop_codon:yes gene_type:complete